MKRPTFNVQQLEKLARGESEYIGNLFAKIVFPERCSADASTNDDQEPENPHLENENSKVDFEKIPKGTKLRAKSIQELQERLNNLQSKTTKSKNKLTYKEKLVKKNLKSKLRKKQGVKKIERAVKLEKAKQTKIDDSETNKDQSGSKMVFSKIDFSNLGDTKKLKKKPKSDPRKLLEEIETQKTKLKKLSAEGETEKAREIKEKVVWKNALAKAQGEKVKDDPDLLKKSVKKQEALQKRSKKKWEKRIEAVKSAKDERQKKRQENIDKRKKQKKTKMLKSAVKKGKVIPGY